MAIRTYEQYKQSLKEMRPNVYKFGELVNDVTTHPATKRTVEGHGQIYKLQNDPEFRDLMTTHSNLVNEPVSRYLSIIQSSEDQIANSRMKRLMFQKTGTCTGGRCAGWTALNAMWATTFDMDADLGTDYHKRFVEWLKSAQRRDITISGALTDPKGDRTKAPHQQDDPDMNLRMIELRDNGIVVRGAKVMICGVAAANEIFILPGSAYREEDKAYSISFVVPKDIDGLTIVETRHINDDREVDEGSGWDVPVSEGGITQAYLFFEDVFVPMERVFMCGEWKYTMSTIMNFILPYRSAIGGCVAGQGDIKIGSALLTSRANGLADKVFSEKITQMAINNETTFAVGIAAAALGKKHRSGVWQPDPLLANVNKVHVATLPYETSRLAQDIAGGIGETGCMPSSTDFNDPKYGHLIQKYMKAAKSAESRVKAARMVEWSTAGAGVPGCMHGGGSPDGARMFVRKFYDSDKSVDMAKRLARIEEEMPDPGRKPKS